MTAAVWPPNLPAQPGLLMTDIVGNESWVAPPSAAPGFVYWNGTTFVTGAAAPSPGGDFVKLDSKTGAGAPATLTFSAIPGGYASLKIIGHGRLVSAAVDDENIWVLFNGDTVAANYSNTQNSGAKTGGGVITLIVAQVNKGVVLAQFPGTLTNAAAMGATEITLPGYDSTAYQKMAISLSGEHFGAANQMFTVSRSATWLSTAAITSITLTAGSGTFDANCRFTLYGLNG